MNKVIKSRCYVLGNDIDTDQIIPAQYLAISLGDPAERARYGGLALTGVPKAQAGLPQGNVPFADPGTNKSPYAIVIAAKNFGCGSSREHAPVALAQAGVQAVVALSFARIFYRNAIDGGYFPPVECEEDLTTVIKTGDEILVDLEEGFLKHERSGKTFTLKPLGAAGEIIFSGGLFEYARRRGLVESGVS